MKMITFFLIAILFSIAAAAQTPFEESYKKQKLIDAEKDSINSLVKPAGLFASDMFYSVKYSRPTGLVNLVDKIFPSDFHFVRYDSIGYSNGDSAYKYIYENGMKQDLFASFVVNSINGNADLNIAPVKVIRNFRLAGSYLNLFNIWKQYFDPGADLTAVQKSGATHTLPKPYGNYHSISFYFVSSGKYWSIFYVISQSK